MRALTLTQPWAGLVASGIKLVENRPRKMIKREDFGKPFAIHASRVLDLDVYKRIAEIAPEISYGGDRTPPGDWFRLSKIGSAVIGIASIVGVNGVEQARAYLEDRSQWRWAFGPVCYVLTDVRSLARPVPCRGWQGFWTLPADVEAAVVEQLR